MNFAIRVEANAKAENWLDKQVFITPKSTWTHRQVYVRSKQIACLLQENNIQEGDKVILTYEDSVNWVSILLATARLGAVCVIVNPYLSQYDHNDIVLRLKPKLAFVNETLSSRFESLISFTEKQIDSNIDNYKAIDYFVENPLAFLYIQFTSGTTGAQKAVPHNHSDMWVYSNSVGRAMLDISVDDIIFSASRLFFAYGFGNSLVFPLVIGASSVLWPFRPNVEEVTNIISKFKVTVLFWVPSGYAALISVDSLKNLSLRLCVTAGEALQPELANRIISHLNTPLLNQLGSTEVGHAYCGTRLGESPADSIGHPLPEYNIEIRNENGIRVVNGQQGELWVTGPSIPDRYFDEYDKEINRTDKLNSVFINGWFKSGDRACKLPDGRYQYLGRVDDMENIMGIKVPPLQVEAVLAIHPNVLEVAVCGIVENGRSYLVAYVCSRQKLSDFQFELHNLVKAQLAVYFAPHRYFQVENLPRTTNGKLRRHILRSTEWYHQVCNTQVEDMLVQSSEEYE